MDLKYLKTFITVAETQNLSRAAERLHLTQSALSLHVKHLQASTGLTLFTREPHGLKLTEKGQMLLPFANKVLDSMADFSQFSSAIQKVVKGKLVMGTILNPEFIRLGQALRTLVSDYPGIQTELRHGMSGWVENEVLEGRLDVGFFLGHPQHAPSMPLHKVMLTPFSYYVIAPKGWQSRIVGQSWQTVAKQPWIWTPKNSAHHRMLSKKFEQLALQPNIVAEVDQEASMLDLVRSGVGLSLARDAVALRESQANGLAVARNLRLNTDLSFICLESRREEPVIQSAFSAVEDAFKDNMGP